MIKALRRIEEKELYHYKNGVKIMGKNPRMSGFLTGLWGDCTDAWGDFTWLKGNCTWLVGDCTGLEGDCSGILGDCTGIKGNCSDIFGNLDQCRITQKNRKKGVLIDDLVMVEE